MSGFKTQERVENRINHNFDTGKLDKFNKNGLSSNE